MLVPKGIYADVIELCTVEAAKKIESMFWRSGNISCNESWKSRCCGTNILWS